MRDGAAKGREPQTEEGEENACNWHSLRRRRWQIRLRSFRQAYFPSTSIFPGESVRSAYGYVPCTHGFPAASRCLRTSQDCRRERFGYSRACAPSPIHRQLCSISGYPVHNRFLLLGFDYMDVVKGREHGAEALSPVSLSAMYSRRNSRLWLPVSPNLPHPWVRTTCPCRRTSVHNRFLFPA